MSMETKAGQTIEVGDTRITPFSKVLKLQAPFSRKIRLVWNRPASVLVTDPAGNEQVLPVQDVTRRAQVMILGAAFSFVLLMWLANRRRGR